MILLLLAAMMIGQQGKATDAIPEPVCEPWETVMYSSQDGVITKKFCELDSNKAFPEPSQVIAHWLDEGPKDFENNFWEIRYRDVEEVGGDCLFVTSEVTFENFHHFKPYKEKYHYILQVTAGDCWKDDHKTVTRIELREK